MDASHSRVEKVAARLLHGYLRWTAGHSAAVWCGGDGRSSGSGGVHEPIRRALASQPIVATYWIADALAVALLPLLDPDFADLFAAVTCVIDDTFTGRVAGRYIERLGGRRTSLSLPDDPDRLRQVLALMNARTSCAFPVDGGGPYRQVGTGIITLSVTLRASIVPIAALARPAFPTVHRSAVRLPMAGTTVFAAIGSPLEPVPDGDRRQQAARLASALDLLGARVRGAANARAQTR